MEVKAFRIFLVMVALGSCARGLDGQDYISPAEENVEEVLLEPEDYITNYGSEAVATGPMETSDNLTLAELTTFAFPEDMKEEEEAEEKENEETKNDEVISNNYPPWLIPTSAEVSSERALLNQLSRIHQTNYNDFENTFPNKETLQDFAPSRRETNDWQPGDDLLGNDMSWTYKSYDSSPASQFQYVDRLLDRQNESVQNYEQPIPLSELPQYYQKNYYYNYYSAPQTNYQNWNGENGIAAEPPRRKPSGGRRKSACKQYLQFLKYAFERLDDSAEYQYDYPDDYNMNPPRRNPPLITTQLVGPMLFIDNSGRVSQGNPKPGAFSGDRHVDAFRHTSKTPPIKEFRLKFFPMTPLSTTLAEMTTSRPKTNSLPPEVYQTETTPQPTLETTPEPTTQTKPPTTTEMTNGKSTTPYTRWPESTIATTEVDISTFSPTIQPTTDSGPPKKSTQYPNPFQKIDNKLMPSPKPDSDSDSDSDKKEDVDCNDKVLPCPDTYNVTYPLNGYCNRYVSCESGRAMRRICPEGLHFNIITKSCDIPHNSFCAYTCPKANGYFGIPGDCGGYFLCKNFVAEYRMCPPKMHWNVQKEFCDFEGFAMCPMTCLRGNEVKNYEGDCRAYIICLNGIPYYHKCPPSMNFDVNFLTCVPEHVSKCENDPKLLTETLNPSKLCSDIQLKLGSKVWCNQ